MRDLHIHLGGAVPSAVLWEILCDNGLHTEYQSFDAFHESLTANPGEIRSLDDFLGRYFDLTELIQSSPAAASVSAYQVVAKAYRRARIEGVELRFNPMKRMRGGLHTLEAIILAALQGLQRASMHYGAQTGVILSLGRDLSLEANWKITEAAIGWRSQGHLHGAFGVVGIDMAGPESGRKEFLEPWINEVAAMFQKAREAGLGTTYHIGETSYTGPEGMIRVIDRVRPDRIGHGIELRNASGADRDRLVGLLKEQNALLEICPTVNMVTHSVKSLDELAALIRFLDEMEIAFCLNTDAPYLLHTNLKREYDEMIRVLGDAHALLQQCHEHARNHTFMKLLDPSTPVREQ